MFSINENNFSKPDFDKIKYFAHQNVHKNKLPIFI